LKPLDAHAFGLIKGLDGSKVGDVKQCIVILIAITYFPIISPAADSKPKPNAVEVKVLESQLPHDENKRSQFLWKTLANKPAEKQFDSYSTEHWKDNFEIFVMALISKANQQKLDSTSLRKALGLVLKDSKDKIVYLPVGAYQTTLDGELVWIINVKWEYPPKEGKFGLGHIRMFAFDQKTLKQVGFNTCM